VTLVDTSSRALRRAYAAACARRAVDRQGMFRRMDTETIDVRTDRPYVDPLVRFFHKRERRR
jgi:hypothetical protein